MPELVPVDHNPFGGDDPGDSNAGAGSSGAPPVRFIPVDHDPWAGFKAAVEQQRRWGMPDAMSQLGDVASKIASIPANIAMTGPRFMGDVMEGRLDPTSPEGIRRAADTALTVAGGGAFGAERGAVGALGGKLGAPYAEKFHGVVPEVTQLPASMLKPSHQFERNGAMATQKASGLSPEEWAKTVDVSDPINASLFNDGSIKISDGHHRQLAGEILGKNVPVRLQAINAKPDDINRLIQQQPQATPSGIRAYHGSPHDFDKFDLSKIGTGEGAQSYGHGLYFAENEGTAKSYRDSLAPITFQGQRVNNIDPQHVAALTLYQKAGDRSAALADIQSEIPHAWTEEDRVHLQKVADILKSDQPLPGPDKIGRMYDVSINADPEHFLDWDKPLSEQHPKVREAVQNRVAQLTSDDPGPRRGGKHILQSQVEQDATGADIYGRLAYKQGAFPEIGVQDHAAATAALRQAGIPGIKYLDQGSRNVAMMKPEPHEFNDGSKGWVVNGPKGDQFFDSKSEAQAFIAKHDKGSTSNYVVFDDKLIDIMKKYGIAGIGALPAMGAYHFRTHPVDHDPFAQ